MNRVVLFALCVALLLNSSRPAFAKSDDLDAVAHLCVKTLEIIGIDLKKRQMQLRAPFILTGIAAVAFAGYLNSGPEVEFAFTPEEKALLQEDITDWTPADLEKRTPIFAPMILRFEQAQESRAKLNQSLIPADHRYKQNSYPAYLVSNILEKSLHPNGYWISLQVRADLKRKASELGLGFPTDTAFTEYGSMRAFADAGTFASANKRQLEALIGEAVNSYARNEILGNYVNELSTDAEVARAKQLLSEAGHLKANLRGADAILAEYLKKVPIMFHPFPMPSNYDERRREIEELFGKKR